MCVEYVHECLLVFVCKHVRECVSVCEYVRGCVLVCVCMYVFECVLVL